MARAGADLQRRVFEALVGDAALLGLLGGAKVFDGVPGGALFPYVAFGQASAADWSTASERGEEHLFALHVWSRARGRKEGQAIAERVCRVVEGLSGAAGGARIVGVGFRESEWRFVPEIGAHHCALRFRAVVETD